MSLFFPTAKNHYRAGAIEPPFLLFTIVVFLFFQSSINFLAVLKPGVLGYSSEITPEKVITLVNQQREIIGLKPLTINSFLNEAAARKAGDMFAFNYWAHTSPSGRDPWSFFKEAGYHYVVAGENLARDFYDTESAVNAWMNSSTHKANILNSNFQETGVAVVNGTLNGISTTLVVQLFATPAPGRVSLPNKEAAGTETASLAETSQKQTIGQEPKIIINPLKATKGLSIFLLGLISGVLILDGYFIIKRKLYRITGRNTGHVAFLGILMLMVLLTQSGMIK